MKIKIRKIIDYIKDNPTYCMLSEWQPGEKRVNGHPKCLEDVVLSLTQEEKEVLMLCYSGRKHVSYNMIARGLDMDKEKVTSLKASARQKIRSYVA